MQVNYFLKYISIRSIFDTCIFYIKSIDLGFVIIYKLICDFSINELFGSNHNHQQGGGCVALIVHIAMLAYFR